MAQPAGWLWGLLPLGLLCGAGIHVETPRIARDVAARAEAAVAVAAGAVPGARAPTVRAVGRDVFIEGEALTAESVGKALAQMQSQFGVRRVVGTLTQVVPQKPYGWAVSRDGEALTLSGFTPDQSVAEANLAAARALPGIGRVADQQRPAFGAPPSHAEAALRAIADAGRLLRGKVGLDDNRYCIEGTAATPDDYLTLSQAATPAGFTAVPCPLEPPTVAPYRWRAVRTADGAVTLSGFHPSAVVRQRLAETIAAAFPAETRVTDLSQPALGAPSAFADLAVRALGDLARMAEGEVELDGGAYRLAGRGPADFAACDALRRASAMAIACPPAPMPPPPEFQPLILPAPVAAPEPVIAPPDLPDVRVVVEAAPPATPEPVVTIAPPDLPEVTAVVEVPPPPAVPETAVAIAPPDLPEVRVVVEVPVPVPPAPPAAPPSPARLAPPPPPAVPWRWAAERSETGLVVSGHVPDEAARQALRQAATGAGLTIARDGSAATPNLRSDPPFAEATAFALARLAGLKSGRVAIADGVLSLSGEAATPQERAALLDALTDAGPPGLRQGSVQILVRPYAFSVSADEAGVRMTGYLPDEGTRAALAALVTASPWRNRLSEAITIVPGAPAGFVDAARLALANLLRLDSGSLRITDDTVGLAGETCRDLTRSEVETAITSGLPAGRTGKAEIGLRQSGCATDPPNTCQIDLDAWTKSEPILFEQGAPALLPTQGNAALLDRAVQILGQCPVARVGIEGHANRDGEGRFDNLGLSAQRAESVRAALVERGVPEARLRARGFGVERPLVPHGLWEAKVKNRRVQFTIER